MILKEQVIHNLIRLRVSRIVYADIGYLKVEWFRIYPNSQNKGIHISPRIVENTDTALSSL